ncbi:MAG: sugar transferase [Deltaproteobacteria bacterium]|nr:sugar transferase [Deltaproteobacteria bacterium]
MGKNISITVWAQVNGWRCDTSIPKHVEHDLFYLENWSLWINDCCFDEVFYFY